MASLTAKSSKRTKSEKSKVLSVDDKSERSEKQETCPPQSVIKYKLSDQHFLDIGWTRMPSRMIASKIIQYKTRMAKPHMDWFKLHRHEDTKYYDDLKTPFIAYDPNGSGQVFYPNGTLAITVNRPKKRTYDMYTVFTPGGRDEMGYYRESQMIAAFDGLGNGIVLNENNDSRLTYNQIGGICRDNERSYAWTWSLRRMEPKIEAFYKDVSSARLEKLMQLFTVKSTKSSAGVKTPKSGKSQEKKDLAKPGTKIVPVEDTISVEKTSMDNVEKFRDEILASIKIICLRLNNHLSLRIVDRRNISLTFSARTKNIRLELGTVVNFDKPIFSYSVDNPEGHRGMLKCRFEFELLDKSLSPENSLYDIAQEYHKIEKIKRKRRNVMTKEKHNFRSSI